MHCYLFILVDHAHERNKNYNVNGHIMVVVKLLALKVKILKLWNVYCPTLVRFDRANKNVCIQNSGIMMPFFQWKTTIIIILSSEWIVMAVIGHRLSLNGTQATHFPLRILLLFIPIDNNGILQNSA